MRALTDHQPANHQEFELSAIRDSTVNTERSEDHCAQGTTSEFVDARTQRDSQNSNTVMFDIENEHCAQPINSEFVDARTQRFSQNSNTVKFDRQNKHGAQEITSQFDDARTQKVNSGMTRAEIHAEGTDTQHILHFEEADDLSETGSLITQAPQSESIRATINALSSWVSAIQPRESWYLAGWIRDSPI